MKRRENIASRAVILFFVLLVMAFVGCDNTPKDPNEAVKKVLMDYLKAQKDGDYEKSFELLHSETRKLTTKDEWVADQAKGVSLVVPAPEEVTILKISIHREKAEVDIKFRGYDPEKTTEIMLTTYLENLMLEPDEVNKIVEKKLLAEKDKYVTDVTSTHVLKKEKGRWKVLIRGYKENE